MSAFTPDQVLALAPDASSAKAGQGLAKPGVWQRVGRDPRSLWGECQGSGKDPYRTQVDLHGPAFQCSCPSRKFPCKHGLGLLLLHAGRPDFAAEAAAPPWVVEWIAKREASAEKKAAKAEAEAAPPDPETAARRAEQREKRSARREDRVRAGLEELQIWLDDTMQAGLAAARTRPSAHWDGLAARMIDAQAPGVARWLREVPTLLAGGTDWAGRTLSHLGRLQLLLHAFGRIDQLPPPLQADVRGALGWNPAEEDWAAGERVRDDWQVVGQRVEDDGQIRAQRTWLLGANTGRSALSWSFAAGGQPLDVSLVPGTVFAGELQFLPGAVPRRARTGARAEGKSIPQVRGVGGIAEALAASARTLAENPWAGREPWLLRAVVPVPAEGGGWLREADGQGVRLARCFAGLWTLLAISGGAPIEVFGEWDGEAFEPLGAWAEGEYVDFRAEGAS
ncbi:MAG: SWIM zinc finger family protein [Verrucomicrobia bacterium]|nr:SWIM zinc finger family protein [Verrucomicrobiota bacterium]